MGRVLPQYQWQWEEEKEGERQECFESQQRTTPGSTTFLLLVNPKKYEYAPRHNEMYQHKCNAPYV